MIRSMTEDLNCHFMALTLFFVQVKIILLLTRLLEFIA